MARRKPSSSSASAGMIVSGTYWPPYGPKRPALADSSNVMLFDCLQECTDEAGVLAAFGVFDAAADVDTQRLQRPQRRGDVLGAQSTAGKAACTNRRQCLPVEGLARAAVHAVGMG